MRKCRIEFVLLLSILFYFSSYSLVPDDPSNNSDKINIELKEKHKDTLDLGPFTKGLTKYINITFKNLTKNQNIHYWKFVPTSDKIELFLDDKKFTSPKKFRDSLTVKMSYKGNDSLQKDSILVFNCDQMGNPTDNDTVGVFILAFTNNGCKVSLKPSLDHVIGIVYKYDFGLFYWNTIFKKKFLIEKVCDSNVVIQSIDTSKIFRFKFTNSDSLQGYTFRDNNDNFCEVIFSSSLSDNNLKYNGIEIQDKMTITPNFGGKVTINFRGKIIVKSVWWISLIIGFGFPFLLFGFLLILVNRRLRKKNKKIGFNYLLPLKKRKELPELLKKYYDPRTKIGENDKIYEGMIRKFIDTFNDNFSSIFNTNYERYKDYKKYESILSKKAISKYEFKTIVDILIEFLLEQFRDHKKDKTGVDALIKLKQLPVEECYREYIKEIKEEEPKKNDPIIKAIIAICQKEVDMENMENMEEGEKEGEQEQEA